MSLETINATVVLHLPAEGPPLATTQDALDLIGEAWAVGAELLAVPGNRFDPSFFDLRSGKAGEFIQKFINYRLQLAIVGDIAAHLAASGALRDFVRESNRGSHIWFLESHADLAERLAPVT